MLAHSFGDVIPWSLLVFGLESRWRIAVGAHSGTVLFIIMCLGAEKGWGVGPNSSSKACFQQPNFLPLDLTSQRLNGPSPATG